MFIPFLPFLAIGALAVWALTKSSGSVSNPSGAASTAVLATNQGGAYTDPSQIAPPNPAAYTDPNATTGAPFARTALHYDPMSGRYYRA